MNPVKPIQNACDVPLNQAMGGMPDVSGGILNYFRPIVLVRVTKNNVRLQLVETQERIESSGVVFPAKRRLDMKPEGQRKWNVKTLFTLPTVKLTEDDIVSIQESTGRTTSYRVMGDGDWSQAGYVTYDLTEDYT